jgi:transposase
MKKQRKYGLEFKERAIKLALELDNMAEAAKKLGVPKHTLYSWVTAAESKNNTTPLAKELSLEDQVRALQRENEDLKKVNHILKQAAAFFSQDHLK